ncbi:MAG: site-specific integrase, partial [Clostridium sp.]|nr:site-specific integrase [Clostridium sp.]
DSRNITDIFSFNSVKIYIETLAQEYRDGKKGKTLSVRQGMLKIVLKEIDIDLLKQCDELFIAFPNDIEHTKPYTDTELIEIAKILQIIYKNYSKHLIDETTPNIFPLYPESKIIGVDKLNFEQKRKNRRTTTYKNNSSLWKADLSRVAYFITCFYTGINSSSLLDIKISDIEKEPFKNVNRHIYKIKSTKGRQGGRANFTDVGFSKKAKLFLESWILISKKINNNNEEGFLFPNILNNKCFKMNVTSARKINDVLLDFSLPSLASSRFRKTKASLIMRATESIFIVAQGLNNTVETASKYYSDGDPVTTEFSLASALYVREKAAMGESLSQAILDSSYIFKDPVREKHLNGKEKKLLNGLRCGDKNGEQSKKIKNLLIKERLAVKDDDVACYKFLDCFGCKFHAVVAEVQDIWLLLSFNDVILEAATRPSLNSTPSKVLDRVNTTLQAILIKIKNDHTEIYNEAYEKYLNNTHPLWEDSKDLDLLLGAY